MAPQYDLEDVPSWPIVLAAAIAVSVVVIPFFML